ncbi:MAG: M20/M25/M40 family metallo-hydrolase [Candidatus Levybacteria bacterium]|nr:M20/M25/M40 family metallo-hydrolase [Candidatus Levybacteria bacterium]
MKHISILRELLKIESVSGKEFHILDYIFKKIKALGLRAFFVQGNLVVKINGRDSSKALIFNAHVDTVSPGNVSIWEYPPFEGSFIDNKMYGLGASDEKATIAAFLILADVFRSTVPSCDIWLSFVVKEEVDGTGSKRFLQWFSKNEKKKYKTIAGILGEPTGLKQIEIAHKGNIFIKIKIIGDSGHASNPTKIKNHAVLKMYDFAKKLENLGREWGIKYSDKLLGSPTIGIITSISAGNTESPNKFPDSCIATFDIRTTPRLHKIALKEIKDLDKHAKIEYIYSPVPYGYTNKSEKIVRIVQGITGAQIAISQSSNDLYFFTRANIPAVVFGPGEKDYIHKQNEYCYADKILQCINFYKKIVEDF